MGGWREGGRLAPCWRGWYTRRHAQPSPDPTPHPTHAGATAGGKGKAVAGGTDVLPSELACLRHTKVINSAYFSPLTGAACGRSSQCAFVLGPEWVPVRRRPSLQPHTRLRPRALQAAKYSPPARTTACGFGTTCTQLTRCIPGAKTARLPYSRRREGCVPAELPHIPSCRAPPAARGPRDRAFQQLQQVCPAVPRCACCAMQRPALELGTCVAASAAPGAAEPVQRTGSTAHPAPLRPARGPLPHEHTGTCLPSARSGTPKTRLNASLCAAGAQGAEAWQGKDARRRMWGTHRARQQGGLTAACLCNRAAPLPARSYISEDFGGLALHPVDLLDAATGGPGWGSGLRTSCANSPAACLLSALPLRNGWRPSPAHPALPPHRGAGG